MLVVGLTGGIGSGKSTFAAMLAAEGALVQDADKVVADLYAGEAACAVEAAFPGVVEDGVVRRDLLAPRVFGDPEALGRLEAIVHPLVRRERERFLDEARARGADVAVLEIPLLFETGAEAEVDATVVVSVPAAVQRARALARPGMSPERLDGILARQWSDAARRAKADFTVDSDGPLEETRLKARALMGKLRALKPRDRDHA
ncbi:MAG: dephospho-CoA kinase [Hyphomicrobiales bacterium]|nr:dephospho-CoA kinase [Hyphomicrobiales bacterium]MDE2016137.1 dephospho-CoA kinase [Hyphomicrobiales bacterium]